MAGQEPGEAKQWFDVQVKPDSGRQLGRTAAFAFAAFCLGAALLAAGAYSYVDTGPPLWVRFIPLTIVCAAVLLRKIAPMTGLSIGTVGFIADIAIGPAFGTLMIYTDNVYSATVRGPRWTPRLLLLSTGVATLVVAGLGLWESGDLRTAFILAAVLAMLLVSPVATGMVVLEHRTRADLERNRAAAVARLAEVDRRAALTEERTRMARELHDTIANHLSAIAMQSSAVISRADMPPAAVRDVVAAIRVNSVAGLAEMRRTIEFLRTTEAVDDPIQHRISDLEELVARMKSAGLDVSVRVTGEARELPVTVEFAAYRIVQEALTNVLKHGQDAAVEITYSGDRLVVRVDNRLPVQAAGLPGSGNGLLGMRERATILGGSFTAGPHLKGWRVHAELPTVSTTEDS